eukprot:365665-Chlamydomonas_euryale.AAC.18
MEKNRLHLQLNGHGGWDSFSKPESSNNCCSIMSAAWVPGAIRPATSANKSQEKAIHETNFWMDVLIILPPPLPRDTASSARSCRGPCQPCSMKPMIIDQEHILVSRA